MYSGTLISSERMLQRVTVTAARLPHPAQGCLSRWETLLAPASIRALPAPAETGTFHRLIVCPNPTQMIASWSLLASSCLLEITQ